MREVNGKSLLLPPTPSKLGSWWAKGIYRAELTVRKKQARYKTSHWWSNLCWFLPALRSDSPRRSQVKNQSMKYHEPLCTVGNAHKILYDVTKSLNSLGLKRLLWSSNPTINPAPQSSPLNHIHKCRILMILNISGDGNSTLFWSAYYNVWSHFQGTFFPNILSKPPLI